MKKNESGHCIITLGKLVSLFGYLDKTGGIKQDSFIKVLLGNEAESIYFSKKGGGSISEGHRNKFINCTDNSVKRVQKDIFIAYFSKEQKKRGTDLIRHLAEVWKDTLDRNPLTPEEFKEKTGVLLNDSLMDPELFDGTILQDIREFVKSCRETMSRERQAEVLSILTVIAITRECSDRLPRWMLPSGYLAVEDTDYDKQIKEALEECRKAMEEERWTEAIGFLENLEKFETYPGSHLIGTQEDLKKHNAEVSILLSQAFRGRWNSLERTEEDGERAIGQLLVAAYDYGSVKAHMQLIREYICDDARLSASPFPYDSIECARECHELIKRYPSARMELGEAYWILYSLTRKGQYIPPDGEDESFFFQKAVEYDHKEAIREHNLARKVSLINGINKSNDLSCGIYYINEENDISDLIYKTKPGKWRQSFYKRDEWGNIEDDWTSSIGRQKHFLISDDYSKNLTELLYLLQQMKNKDEGLKDPFARVEFYLRGEEEKVAPFIDTAMSRMEDMVFPVHIIDEDKIASRVIARHPLFYPICRNTKDESALLTFVIIGSSKCCDWLLRESFWMMTFLDKSIMTRILLLAPDASKIEDRIKGRCSGMKPSFTANPDSRSGGEMAKSFPFIRTQDCEFASDRMFLEIEKALNEGKTYFAVDTGSDLDNAALAMQIREITISKWAERCATETQSNPVFPAIAFRCKNPDIAYLSRRTVILDENLGNRWVNNYALIPFGQLDRIYHWDALTRDLFYEISMNAHLQFDLGDDYDLSSVSDLERLKKSLKYFYRRTYNRDSSMSVCLSIPYRMYQGIAERADKSDDKSSNYSLKPFLPREPLNILDDEIFYSSTTFDRFTRKWNKEKKWMEEELFHEDPIDHNTVYTIDSPLYRLGAWEQERWNRWMISRGWNGVKNRNVIEAYYSEGSEQHQLYIGRIHPLINTFEEVGFLSKYLETLSKEKLDFQMKNISSLQSTVNILGMKWTRDVKEYFENIEIEDNAIYFRQ